MLRKHQGAQSGLERRLLDTMPPRVLAPDHTAVMECADRHGFARQRFERGLLAVNPLPIGVALRLLIRLTYTP